VQRIIDGFIGFWVREGFVRENDQDIYSYGLELLISTVMNILALLALGLIFGRLAETAVVLAVMLPMQSFAGGYHANTHLKCFLIMIIGWFPVMWMIDSLSGKGAAVVSCAAITVILRLAPVRHVNVPMSGERVKRMKLYSWVFGLTAVAASGLLLFCGEPAGRHGIAISAALCALSASMLAAYVKNELSRSNYSKPAMSRIPRRTR
jgi:accessory gene regulator B